MAVLRRLLGIPITSYDTANFLYRHSILCHDPFHCAYEHFHLLYFNFTSVTGLASPLLFLELLLVVED